MRKKKRKEGNGQGTREERGEEYIGIF